MTLGAIMISVNRTALEQLHKLLLDYCFFKGVGLEKNRKDLLAWCFEKGIGFKVSPKVVSGNTTMQFDVVWQYPSYENFELGGIKMYFPPGFIQDLSEYALEFDDTLGEFLLRIISNENSACLCEVI